VALFGLFSKDRRGRNDGAQVAGCSAQLLGKRKERISAANHSGTRERSDGGGLPAIVAAEKRPVAAPDGDIAFGPFGDAKRAAIPRF
jgi:hypothetical protein